MANRICPRCGGNHTARILWGMPAWSKELEKEIKEEKIKLDGCMISYPMAKYHCFDCDEHILFETSKEEAKTVSFLFESGGFFDGHKGIEVKNLDGKFTARYIAPFNLDDSVIEVQLSADAYMKYIHNIFASGIVEWDEDYVDPNILDGIQWSVLITYDDGTTLETGGSNAYPPLWKKFLKAVNSIGGIPAIK